MVKVASRFGLRELNGLCCVFESLVGLSVGKKEYSAIVKKCPQEVLMEHGGVSVSLVDMIVREECPKSIIHTDLEK